MKRPKAIIFDLDGVLTDTSEYHYLSWKRLADEAGIPFTRQENDEHLRGVSRKESLTYLLKGRKVSDAQFQEMMERKNRYYNEMIKNMTPKDLVDGGRQLLEEIRRRESRSRSPPAVKTLILYSISCKLWIFSTTLPMATASLIASPRLISSFTRQACYVYPLPRAWSSKMLTRVSRARRPGGCRHWASGQQSVFTEQTKFYLRSLTNIW